jgi:ferredoxin-NADP reductase
LGFELYEDLIDYSFDSIDNSEIRLNSALKEVKRIYNIGGNGILEWYKKNVDKIEHNKSKFFEYKFSDMIKETITDLKKQFSSTESYKNII